MEITSFIKSSSGSLLAAARLSLCFWSSLFSNFFYAFYDLSVSFSVFACRHHCVQGFVVFHQLLVIWTFSECVVPGVLSGTEYMRTLKPNHGLSFPLNYWYSCATINFSFVWPSISLERFHKEAPSLWCACAKQWQPCFEWSLVVDGCLLECK